VVAAAVGLLGVGAGVALRDTTPPELWLEAPAVVVAGQPFEVHVSASKPVTFRLRYGDDALEEVAQELRATLVAAPGRPCSRSTRSTAAGAPRWSSARWTVAGRRGRRVAGPAWSRPATR
jgi:hypothetical protein